MVVVADSHNTPSANRSFEILGKFYEIAQINFQCMTKMPTLSFLIIR